MDLQSPIVQSRARAYFMRYGNVSGPHARMLFGNIDPADEKKLERCRWRQTALLISMIVNLFGESSWFYQWVRGTVVLHDAQVHVDNLWLEACALRFEVPGETDEELVARLKSAQAHEDASNQQATILQQTADRLYIREVQKMEQLYTTGVGLEQSTEMFKTLQERRVTHYEDLKNKNYTHIFAGGRFVSAADARSAKRLLYNEIRSEYQPEFWKTQATGNVFTNWLWSMRNVVSIR
jgi:hypothetical protein